MTVRLGNAMVSYAIYLRQMIWPVGLAAFYPQADQGSSDVAIVVSLLLVAAVTGGVLASGRRRPWLLTGWFWYLGMLLPVIGIIKVASYAHADRYTYLPQIGIYIAVTWRVADWGAKSRAGRLTLGAVKAGTVGLLMLGAWRQAAFFGKTAKRCGLMPSPAPLAMKWAASAWATFPCNKEGGTMPSPNTKRPCKSGRSFTLLITILALPLIKWTKLMKRFPNTKRGFGTQTGLCGRLV